MSGITIKKTKAHKILEQFIILLITTILIIGCAPVIKMNVLIQMMADQEKFFRNEMIPPFEKGQHADISVISYGNTDSLEFAMDKYGSSAGLVKVPFDKSRSIMTDDVLIPLNSILSTQEMKKFKDEHLLTSLGVSNGKNYLIPRKFETRIMVFCKSKVDDAISVWHKYANEIDSVLVLYNGYGLPATYLLEENPDMWDYYDIFVVGWIWAHSLYDGELKPRVAHRGRRYSGTALRIIDRIYQLNGDSSNVISMQGDPVIDAIHWESLYAAAGIYNPDMWEKEWSGAGIWKAFNEGTVFLSFMTQLDCFFLHGTGRDNLTGYFKDPADMGTAIMPQGCSIGLDATGMPLRLGKRSITTGGWWWAIPRDSPDPKMSFALASHIISTSSQIQECSRFGMIPVRKEVLSDMMMLFGGGWISEIYDVSFRQIMNNGHTSIPLNRHFSKISNLYLDLWYDIVVNKNWSKDGKIPSRDYIRERINEVYVGAAQKVILVP